ncbi:MAG: hypothetical protein ACJ8J7_13190 [Sulfurifustaceae bacterium]
MSRPADKSLQLWILALTVIAAFMVSLDALVVKTALPAAEKA